MKHSVLKVTVTDLTTSRLMQCVETHFYDEAAESLYVATMAYLHEDLRYAAVRGVQQLSEKEEIPTKGNFCVVSSSPPGSLAEPRVFCYQNGECYSETIYKAIYH